MVGELAMAANDVVEITFVQGQPNAHTQVEHLFNG